MKEWLSNIKYWFRLNFNKDKWNLIKEAVSCMPYDYSYIYKLESAQINAMIRYFESLVKNNHEFLAMGWYDTKHMIRDMKIYVKLISIFTEEENLFDYVGNFKKNKYTCKVHVNLRNYKRFINNPHLISTFPHELYILKAKSLYNKIKKERTEAWWY